MTAMLAHPGCIYPTCFLYVCPTSGQWECGRHSGFDVCCADLGCPGNYDQPA